MVVLKGTVAEDLRLDSIFTVVYVRTTTLYYVVLLKSFIVSMYIRMYVCMKIINLKFLSIHTLTYICSTMYDIFSRIRFTLRTF